MAQTTTAINACGAEIMLDNDSGTPTDVSGSANNANLSLSKDLAEGHTFDGDWAITLECKKKGSLEIEALYTTASGEAVDIFEEWFTSGGARTVSIYPNGNTTGERSYVGEFRLGNYDALALSASEASPMKVMAKLQPTGAITFGVVA